MIGRGEENEVRPDLLRNKIYSKSVLFCIALALEYHIKVAATILSDCAKEIG